jgi:hypothetical protein
MGNIGERHTAWYSIVRYVSDEIKGEILNVGLVMNIPETGEMLFKIIQENNSKLKAILVNQVDKKVYRFGMKYLEYILSSVNQNDLTLPVNVSSKSFVNDLLKMDIPNGFLLTDTRYAKTRETHRLFNDILRSYIGEKFLLEEIKTNTMQVKKFATSVITQRNLIDTKIKTNVKIKPIPTVSLNYNIDFGYEENEKFNFIQVAPEKLASANEWFQRMNMISSNYQNTDRIVLLYNSNTQSNEDRTVDQMVEFLKSNDNRVTSFDIFSNRGVLGFNNELVRIGKQAGDISEIDKFISA